MVNALLKAGDRLAGRFVPKAKASAGCAYETYYTNCVCRDRGNGTGGYFCDEYYIAGNCTAHLLKSGVETGSC